MHRTAATPCAISVAIATPLTPISHTKTKMRSKMILRIAAKIKKYKGVLESPNALNKLEIALYKNVKINPRKIICK